MNSLIDQTQREGLEAFTETLVGEWLAAHPEVTLSRVVDRLDQRIALLPASIRRSVREFVRRLASPARFWRTSGSLIRFSRLSLSRREAMLQELLGNRLSPWSGVAQSLYRQVVFACSVLIPESATSLKTETTFEERPTGNRFEIAGLKPGQTQLACEWLVVGSGPAGSIMAAELAELGQSVLLVDQGSLLADGLQLSEAEANRRVIETFGAWTRENESVVVSAGRTFGGGSVINWGTCIDPPDTLLAEWSRSTGFDFATSDGFRHSLFAVRQRLGVALATKQHPGDQLLQAGADRLGIEMRPLSNNTGGCGECTGCQFGCPNGSKRDMRETWLVDASRLGVFLLPGCRIRSLKIKSGVALQAEAELSGSGPDPRKVTIAFRNCVLAAGAIHTPSILLNSGWTNPHVGKHLGLHPSVIVPVLHDRPVAAGGSPVQSLVCEALQNLDGHQHGVIIENSFFSRGLASLCLPWRTAAEFAQMMRLYPHWTASLVLARDQRLGTVRCDGEGNPVVRYKLGRSERRWLNAGVELIWQMALAGDAKAVYGPWWNFVGAGRGELAEQTRPSSLPGLLPHRAREFLHQRRRGMKLWSAHQMGTCRMADSPQRGVVSPRGQVYGLQNVFICDSSVFPSPAGINPFLTVASLAHFLAQQIKAGL